MTGTAAESVGSARQLKPALLNGLRQRCPQCGEGKLFRSYLKVSEACPACGEALHHHRADDMPAYLTVLIVAHLIGVALPLLFGHMHPVLLAVALCAGATVLMLLMLPATKSLTVPTSGRHVCMASTCRRRDVDARCGGARRRMRL